MPRQGQIMLKYLHPHTHVVVNDFSKFEDDVASAADDAVRFISVIASSKGRDRQVITFDNVSDALEEFGMPNYNLHGQPIYNMYAALSSGSAKVHALRIMPDDATYANAVIVAKVKSEGGTLKVKYESMKLDNFSDEDSLAATMKTMAKIYPDAGVDGYSVYPIMGINSQGRGNYGNAFRVRVLSDLQSDEDNDFKNYRMEVLTSEKSLIRKEDHSVSLYDMAIVSRDSLFANDVINDATRGSSRIAIHVDSSFLEKIYELWLNENPEIDDVVPYTEFDFLYGKKKDGKKIAKFEIEDGSFAFDSMYGIILAGGDDGEFTTRIPKPKKVVVDEAAMKQLSVLTDSMAVNDLVYCKNSKKWYKLVDVDQIAENEGWLEVSFDREAAMDKEYIKAFNGNEAYDNGILSKRRCPAEFILDANYSNDVKRAMVSMGLKRGDCRIVMDAGILSTSSQVLSWADEFKAFNHYTISKECQNYLIVDPYTGKKIPVTTTYFLAQFLAPHILTFGNHVPFTGEAYAKIGGHVKGSMRPLIDADDMEVKEAIYAKAKINYYECIGENSYIRGTQLTSQNLWSDLSEENNVNVLLDIKRQAEDYVNKKFYNFAEPEDRKKFKEDVDRIFSSYPGIKCRSIECEFGMNKWEEERSILHLYISVVFKTMAKRNIVEIDINSRVK